MKNKIVKLLLLCVLVSVATIFAKPVLSRLKMALFFGSIQKTTVSLLRTEKMKFLVTHRLVTVVNHNEENKGLSRWVAGENTRSTIATVRVYYGIDLQKISEVDVFKNESGIQVKLPDPEVLEVVVDHKLDEAGKSKIRTYKRRSGLHWIIDGMKGFVSESIPEDAFAVVLGKLQEEAEKTLRDNGAFPTRDDIVLAMNEWSELLSKQLGVPIQFE